MRNQFLSRSDVKEYLHQFSDVTAEEKSELSKWLKAGNDFRENACFYADESGSLMDFITAMRFEKELYELRLADPEQFSPSASFANAGLPF